MSFKIGLNAQELDRLAREYAEAQALARKKYLEENMPGWLETVKANIIWTNQGTMMNYVNIDRVCFRIPSKPNTVIGDDDADAIIAAINESGEGFQARNETLHLQCESMCADLRCGKKTIYVWWKKAE
jgi:hypothetical protein